MHHQVLAQATKSPLEAHRRHRVIEEWSLTSTTSLDTTAVGAAIAEVTRMIIVFERTIEATGVIGIGMAVDAERGMIEGIMGEGGLGVGVRRPEGTDIRKM